MKVRNTAKGGRGVLVGWMLPPDSETEIPDPIWADACGSRVVQHWIKVGELVEVGPAAERPAPQRVPVDPPPVAPAAAPATRDELPRTVEAGPTAPEKPTAKRRRKARG